MIYPKTKKEITDLVLGELPNDSTNIWKELSNDDTIFRWFQTGRGGSGLRLTEQGMQAFALAKLAHYDFDIDVKKIKSSDYNTFVSKLTKKLACPYYLGVKKTSEGKKTFIRIYDHKIAMMLTLYGDLHDYVDSVK